MTNKKKILIGGLGGITPVLMNLLVVDLELLLMRFTVIALIGYLIRVVILFYMGGIVAFLNKSEKDPVKLFQLGIVAPALITAFINGTNVDVPEMKNDTETSGYSNTIDTEGNNSHFDIISVAFAQKPDTEKLKRFTLPEESTMQQLFRGLIGSKPKNLWFVISGSHTKKEDAIKQVKEIQKKGFKADVYAPNETQPNYSVVIGAYLTHSEAVNLRQKAISEGLLKTYLWVMGENR